MPARSRGSAHLGSALRRVNGNPHICMACRRNLLGAQRQYASVAETPSTATSQTAPPTAHLDHVPPVTASTLPQQSYEVNAGLVLTRPPLITKDLTSFEKAFYLYQRRLNERLALPFTRYFYYPKGTPGDVDWKRKMRERVTPARDIGNYNPYREEGWNDELLVGAQESETEHQMQSLLRDAESVAMESEAPEPKSKQEITESPSTRITEADRKGDERSLARRLDRTLYLLVKRDENRYRFPASPVEGKESLYQAAERIAIQTGGVNMNTWVVGSAPIGHFTYDHRKPKNSVDQRVEEFTEKVFFMKARIMAGQPVLDGNQLGYRDYKWLCKDEIEQATSPRYYSAIRNMLASR